VVFNAGILREIAQGTGAEFFSANSIQGIKDIYTRINQLEKRGDEIKKKSSPLKLLSQSQPNFAEMNLGWSSSKIVSRISEH
jgi:hypothetical protein